MPNKKPPAAPAPPAKTNTRPATRNGGPAIPGNPRQQPDNRWQRTKRYGWDSR